MQLLLAILQVIFLMFRITLHDNGNAKSEQCASLQSGITTYKLKTKTLN